MQIFADTLDFTHFSAIHVCCFIFSLDASARTHSSILFLSIARNFTYGAAMAYALRIVKCSYRQLTETQYVYACVCCVFHVRHRSACMLLHRLFSSAAALSLSCSRDVAIVIKCEWFNDKSQKRVISRFRLFAHFTFKLTDKNLLFLLAFTHFTDTMPGPDPTQAPHTMCIIFFLWNFFCCCHSLSNRIFPLYFILRLVFLLLATDLSKYAFSASSQVQVGSIFLHFHLYFFFMIFVHSVQQ